MDVGWQSIFCTTETDILYQSVRPKKPVCPRETSSTIGAFIQATGPMFPSPGLQTQKKSPMILLDVFSNKKMLDVVFWCVCIYAYIYIYRYVTDFYDSTTLLRGRCADAPCDDSRHFVHPFGVQSWTKRRYWRCQRARWRTWIHEYDICISLCMLYIWYYSIY